MKNENYDVIVDNGNVYDISGNTGWICPKCGTTVSPQSLVCPICHAKRTNETLKTGEQLICE